MNDAVTTARPTIEVGAQGVPEDAAVQRAGGRGQSIKAIPGLRDRPPVQLPRNVRKRLLHRRADDRDVGVGVGVGFIGDQRQGIADRERRVRDHEPEAVLAFALDEADVALETEWGQGAQDLAARDELR